MFAHTLAPADWVVYLPRVSVVIANFVQTNEMIWKECVVSRTRLKFFGKIRLKSYPLIRCGHNNCKRKKTKLWYIEKDYIKLLQECQSSSSECVDDALWVQLYVGIDFELQSPKKAI